MNIDDAKDDSSSVFSDLLAVLNHFMDELIQEICISVMLEISARSRSYRKDRFVLFRTTLLVLMLRLESNF